MTERTAACACGQVRATCRGEPSKVSLCHYRRTSDSAFDRWPADGFD